MPTVRAKRFISVLGVAMLLATLSRATCIAAPAADPVQGLAESFVSLALQLGSLSGHEDEVDSYFGPDSLRPAGNQKSVTAADLLSRAHLLLGAVETRQRSIPSRRGARLLARVRSFAALLEAIENPRRWRFDEEASRVYSMPVTSAESVSTQQALAALDAALPGGGGRSERLAEFRSRFVVAAERRRTVFERALQECRKRTLAHWTLPEGERLDVEWTSDVGAAWHRFRGNSRSTLQINPDAVALIGSMIDAACHEAYPGHHAQFLSEEEGAGAEGLPVEDRIVLLRSPLSVLLEGAANFGVELAFPPAERVAFERDTLFPLAGLDPSQVDRYETVQRLVDQLSSAAGPILAAYRDGRISAATAASRLDEEAQIASPAALLEFADRYGAYTLGYTTARDRVGACVKERSRHTGKDEWTVLREIVSAGDISALAAGGGW